MRDSSKERPPSGRAHVRLLGDDVGRKALEVEKAHEGAQDLVGLLVGEGLAESIKVEVLGFGKP